MDIFKERKKKRKQDKKKRNLSPSQSGEGPGNGKCERRDSDNTSPGSPGKKGSGGTGTLTGEFERQNSGYKPRTAPGEKVGSSEGGQTAKIKGKENGKSSENLSKKGSFDGHHASTENGKEQKQKKEDVPVERGRGIERDTLRGPQHFQPSLPSTPPPPGLGKPLLQAPSQETNRSTSPKPNRQSAASNYRKRNQARKSKDADSDNQSQSSHSSRVHPVVPSPRIPDPSRMSLEDHYDPPETLTPPQPHQSQHQRPLSPQQPPSPVHRLQPPSDALFITVPRNERPETLPGQPESSLAVPAARHFIGKYYSHFDGTSGAQIGDLIRYYTLKAQKSVSIGGAHSVVTGRRDITAQIHNLAGAAFIVRGVVAQDTADGRGVHILVTGTARTSLNGAPGGMVSSFAHSISLVPIDDGLREMSYRNEELRTAGEGTSCPGLLEALGVGFPFQIHNDALALLSGDAGPVTPTPIPRQPMQMQQQPPPPPGLF